MWKKNVGKNSTYECGKKFQLNKNRYVKTFEGQAHFGPPETPQYNSL